ncbi:MAG TPA: tetratricopeptide repeat protein, partial [Chthonomonadaceae bacterium]|nr:tetratricopeptide repeat protein [Chthonomonadaceae bacterium]
FLWALLGAARSGARRRFLLLAAAWMAFFAAILTKEQAFALLPLVPLAFLWFSSEQRLDWRAVAPFLVGSGLYLAMWHAVIPVFLRPPVYPWSYRLALGGATVSYYTHLLVAPSPATLFMVTARPFAGWSWILAGYGALALGWLGVWKWRRTRPALAWFLLMALLGILPVANLVPASGQALSAYRAGLAGLGVVALLAYAVGSLPRVRWQLAAASLLLVWYGSLTCWGEAQWQDALHVTRAGMQCDPESYFYREYHTYALLDAGQTQQALSETDALLDRTFQGRDWRDADVVASALQAPSFLARMAAIDGALSSPAAQIAKTLIVDGKLHLDAHHYAEAGQAFTAALRLNSADPNSHVGLGHVLTAEGDWQDGLRHYREAIHLQPATAFYYLVLANAEWRHRDREAALSTLQDGYDRVGQQKPLLSQWMRKIENAQARP